MSENDAQASLKAVRTAADTMAVTETQLDSANTEKANGAGAVETITLTGRLDVVSSTKLRKTIQEHLEAGRTRLLIDLSIIDFVDSAGLAALVRGRKLARKAGGDLRLVQPRRADAMRVFELTTFDQIFDMDDSVENMIKRWSTS